MKYVKYVNFSAAKRHENEIFDLIENSSLTELRLFLQSSESEIDSQDSHGLTALHIACQANMLKIVETLVSAGANLYIQDDVGDLPIHKAATAGHSEIVEFLIEIDKDQINQSGNVGWTPLHQTAARNKTSTVRYLILRGADINKLSLNKETPVLRAAIFGCFESIEELLQCSKINIYQKDNSDKDLLCYLTEHSKLPQNKYGNSKVFSLIKTVKLKIEKDEASKYLDDQS